MLLLTTPESLPGDESLAGQSYKMVAGVMKGKAEAIGAPVKIVIVKNAGHNWRKVDSEINPTRDEIVERTVAFLVEHAR